MFELFPSNESKNEETQRAFHEGAVRVKNQTWLDQVLEGAAETGTGVLIGSEWASDEWKARREGAEAYRRGEYDPDPPREEDSAAVEEFTEKPTSSEEDNRDEYRSCSYGRRDEEGVVHDPREIVIHTYSETPAYKQRQENVEALQSVVKDAGKVLVFAGVLGLAAAFFGGCCPRSERGLSLD